MYTYPALYTVYNAAPTPLVSDALSTTQSQTVDSTLLALATTKKGIIQKWCFYHKLLVVFLVMLTNIVCFTIKV